MQGNSGSLVGSSIAAHGTVTTGVPAYENMVYEYEGMVYAGMVYGTVTTGVPAYENMVYESMVYGSVTTGVPAYASMVYEGMKVGG
jgi:hypothetical protein